MIRRGVFLIASFTLWNCGDEGPHQDAGQAASEALSSEPQPLQDSYRFLRFPVLDSEGVERSWESIPIESFAIRHEPFIGAQPAYSALFVRGGEAEYLGEENVSNIGKVFGSIDVVQFGRIAQLIEFIEFEELESEYFSYDAMNPTVRIEVTWRDGTVKRVSEHWSRAPVQFFAVRAAIEGLVHEVEWGPR